MINLTSLTKLVKHLVFLLGRQLWREQCINRFAERGSDFGFRIGRNRISRRDEQWFGNNRGQPRNGFSGGVNSRLCEPGHGDGFNNRRRGE